MHQARLFFLVFPSSIKLVDTAGETLADALTRFNTDINGDDRTASNPVAPIALVMNRRRVKFLSSGCMQNLSAVLKAETGLIIFQEFS